MAPARAHSDQALLHCRRSARDGASRVRRRRRSLPARAVLHHVRHASVDDSPVRRLLHRRRVQRVLSPQSCRRAERSLGRIRPRHAPRLRLRQRARRRRRRQSRRGHRLRRGHEGPLRTDSAGPDVRLHDHERRRAAHHGLLHRRRGRAGRRAGKTQRDHSERHPQGVHGPQHLHLSAGAINEDHRRHLPLLLRTDAEVQLHLHQRLPHAGGRRHRRHRAGLYARRWPGVHPHRHRRGPQHRRLRAASQLLLGHRHEPLHGDRQDARRARPLGQAHPGVQPQEPEVHGAAHTLTDLRLEPDRAGCLQQHLPHSRGGDGRRAGPHPVAAYQRPRRSDRPPQRILRPHRPQHADLPAGGDRHHQGRRSLGRQLLCRKSDPRPDAQGLAAHPGDRSTRRHDQGHRDRHSQDAHRGGRGPPPGAHRLRPRDHRRRE